MGEQQLYIIKWQQLGLRISYFHKSFLHFNLELLPEDYFCYILNNFYAFHIFKSFYTFCNYDHKENVVAIESSHPDFPLVLSVAFTAEALLFKAHNGQNL